MRAVRLAEHGGPDVLAVEDIDDPRPDRNEVVVRILSAGINPVDTYFRDGSYPPVTLPFTPGVDFAGEVTDIGENIEHVQLGDQVFGTGIGNASYQGGYAEYAAVPSDRFVPIPDGVNPIQAGGAGVVGGTAWRGLIDHGELRPEDVCLIHGGSGGVGHVAIQIAAAAGARVITTASDSYRTELRDLGADTVISYDEPDIVAEIQSAAPDGIDVVLDHKMQEYLSLDTEVVGEGGRIVGIGEDDPRVVLEDTTAARSRDVRIILMSMFNTPDLRVPLRRIGRLMARDAISVEIDQVYNLSEAQTAHRALFEESFLGKRVFAPE